MDINKNTNELNNIKERLKLRYEEYCQLKNKIKSKYEKLNNIKTLIIENNKKL